MYRYGFGRTRGMTDLIIGVFEGAEALVGEADDGVPVGVIEGSLQLEVDGALERRDSIAAIRHGVLEGMGGRVGVCLVCLVCLGGDGDDESFGWDRPLRGRGRGKDG